MLHIHYSNDIDQLVDVVAEIIARPRSRLLAAEQIVVDDTRTGAWLNQALSDRLGVAANIEYRLPGQFLWSVVGRVIPELPERLAATPEILRWMIYARFRALDDDPILRDSVLARYVRQATGVEQYQLAGQLAHCYDQYALLRPEWLRQWETAGDTHPGRASENVAQLGVDDAWDARLWRELMTERDLWHWARVVEAFQSTIHSFDGQGLGERMIVFVPQSLSPGYLSILNGIAEFTDVYIPCFNPCQEYWGDIVAPRTLDKLAQHDEAALYFEVGNRLLASMGTPGRDFVDALQDLEAQTSESYLRTCRSGALGRLQQDILTLSEMSLTSEHEDAGDDREGLGRVAIHSCHSPIREAEVLLDALLTAWSEDSDLDYADICVLTPDVDRYGPLIEAVLRTSGHRIPVHYGQRGAARVPRIVDGIRMLVGGGLDELPVTGIVNLLRIPAVARRYAIDESDRQALRRQLNEANVHRFLDAAHADSHGETHDEVHERARSGSGSGSGGRTFTWSFGADRALLGYLIGPRFGAPGEASVHSHDSTFAGVAPLLDTGPADVERFDRLMTLVEDLHRFNGRLQERQSPAAWGRCLGECLQTVFEPAAGDEIEHAQIRRVIDEYVTDVSAGVSAELDVSPRRDGKTTAALVIESEVLGAGLSESLERLSSAVGRSDAGVGIRVAPLAWGELRPCKLLCLVGMNQELFPRRNTRPSFDRLLADRRRGDRSPRDDDRYVFLRACMTPRHELFVSYCGQDVVSNEERPMASVVNELCDYLSAMSPPSPMIRHPLHGYDPRYFAADDPEFHSFQETALDIADTVSRAPNEPVVFWSGGGCEPGIDAEASSANRTLLELDDVLALFRAPSRWMLQQHCAVRYLELNDALSSREPNQLDPLASYQLMSWLAGRLDEADSLAAATAAGLLPLGRMGEWYLRQSERSSAPMRSLLAEETEGTVSEWFEIGSNGSRIAGLVAFSGTGDITLLRPGRLREQDYVSAWLQHLFVCAARPQWRGRTKVVSPNKVLWFESGDALDAAVVAALLSDIVAVVQRVYRQPVLMEPELAWSALSKARSTDHDRDDARRRMVRVAWQGSDYRRGVGQEPHVARLFSGELEQRMDELLEFSRTIYEPMSERANHSEWDGGGLGPGKIARGGAA